MRGGEPVEGVEVRLVRCRGARRYTRVPSFELANPSGVPIETGNDNCDVFTASTRADGTASIPSVPVGEASVLAPRESIRTYLLRTAKPGYTRARRLVTPDVLLESMRFLAYVQMAGGNEVAARQTLDELLGLAPGDAYALRASGVLAVGNRDWPLARSHFATYVQLNPDSADAQLMMGNLMLETSEVAAALTSERREYSPSRRRYDRG